MASQLSVRVGQHSDKGRKDSNQDFHGVTIPPEPQLSTKGLAIVLADGISSSAVSHIASQAAVKGFLADYFCTSDAWSVKKSAQSVLQATNAWLYAQTRQSDFRFDKDRGYVCTLSALIIKSNTAYLFHVGDTRIYRASTTHLEQLTTDHRVQISAEQSYLARALGMDSHLEIDYQHLPVESGDVFILATDGVYEFVTSAFILQTLQQYPQDLNGAAQAIVAEAYAQGSHDNLSVQLLSIDSLPRRDVQEVYQQLNALPFPPLLDARMQFDGYHIIRCLHASSRSHLYLAATADTGMHVVIKAPSLDLRDDPAYLEHFLLEEWIARRIDSPHILKACETHQRQFLYIVTEYIEGQTLRQWMLDHPQPDLETVRGIVEQLAKGMRAFHRLEMLHQDLRPDNIMIDSNGTVKIIDFGATRVAGLIEIASPIEHHLLLGTAQYSAPEYFIGEAGSPRSDQFSLGVITYQLLSGKLPYGAEVAKCKSKSQQQRLHYDSLLYTQSEIPAWVDDAIKKAVQINPYKRYEELSEFLFDLRHPNQAFLNKTRVPLLERNPLAFWRGVSILELLLILYFIAHYAR